MQDRPRALVFACLMGALSPGMNAAAAPSPAAGPPTATVAQGRLEGIALDEADAFLGVPFAKPPLGPLRWKRPLAPKPWRTLRKATSFANSCMQVLNPPEGRDPWTPEYMIPPGISEDCLYLNIWTPHKAAGRKLPVLVFIHGGGYTEGSGSVPVYNGANLAAHGDIVVVTINYRLDAFGYLVSPELSKEAGGSSGDYGLMDQVESLKWVKANIAAFGGDPERITVGGQSSGAGSVHALIASPEAKGLFVRAIAESGSGMTVRGTPASLAEAGGAKFQALAGAKTLADLRKMPADAVLAAAVAFRKANPGEGFRPSISAPFLPIDANQAQMQAGSFNDTPILTGFNRDEGSGAYEDYGAWPMSAIAKRLAGFGAQSATAKAIYAPGGEIAPTEVGKALIRDRGLAYMDAWAIRRAPATQQPMYLYQYMHPEPGPKSARYGAFHTSEVPYWFQNLDAPGRNFTAVDRQVSATLSAYWLNFVKTGNPNGPGLANWPAFEPTQEAVARLGPDVTVSRILPIEKRDLYRAYYSAGGVLGPH